MSDADGLRYSKIPLNNGSDEIPALGFGTLIPDPIATKDATKAALEVGFRQFDCAERYRNEEHVGEAMRAVFKEGKVKREDVFVGTKLWNNNHRPERVKPASRQVSKDCNSTMSICTASILHSLSNPATSKTRGTRKATRFMTMRRLSRIPGRLWRASSTNADARRSAYRTSIWNG